MKEIVNIGNKASGSCPDGIDDRIEAIADEIKHRLKNATEDILEIGKQLTEAKKLLGHGNFLPWIEAKFQMSHQTAANFMNAWKKFGQNPNGLDFAPKALYLLAAPSTPEEQAALTRGSPLYQWREQQAQQAMARAMRAKGISDSRFAVGESARLNAQLAAEEQDRRIAQLMSIYQQGLGQSGVNAQFAGDLAGIETGAGSKMADISTEGTKMQAGVGDAMYQNLARLEQDTSTKRAGLAQDLGDSVAASYGAAGAARASSFATAAQNAMAGYNQPSPLQQAVSIFSAAKGGGKWW